jgi:hypothetical protein
LGKRGPLPEKLALLFRLKYLQQIEDREKVTERLGITEDSLRVYESRLYRKLVNSVKQVSPERLRLICPECLEPAVWKDPENGERVCTNCGYVVDQQPDMVHRLPFDETYAMENPLVFNKSLGTADTLRRNYGLAKVLGKARNSKEKIQAVAEIVGKYERGKLSLVDAGVMVREIFVKGGSEDIASAIAEANREKKPPAEIARRIVNKFDAIPVHQMMTLHEVHEPPLMRKMKEHGENLRKESGLDRPNLICDPNVFSVALGNLIERVCNFALFVEGVKHSPKDLTEVCFLRTVQKMKPDVTIEGINPPADALMFVDLVTRILSFGKVKEVKSHG